MPRHANAPAGTGASRDKLAGGSRFFSTLDAHRAQFLIAAYSVRPECARLIASMAFGGAA